MLIPFSTMMKIERALIECVEQDREFKGFCDELLSSYDADDIAREARVRLWNLATKTGLGDELLHEKYMQTSQASFDDKARAMRRERWDHALKVIIRNLKAEGLLPSNCPVA